MSPENTPAGRVSFRVDAPGTLTVVLEGDWKLSANGNTRESLNSVWQEHPDVRRVAFSTATLGRTGSGLVSFILGCHEAAQRHGCEWDDTGLPAGIRRLLRLATSGPERSKPPAQTTTVSLVERVGHAWLDWRHGALEAVRFLGECTLAAATWIRNRGAFRRIDFLLMLQQCGADALPIVSLISLLVGLILAFVGAVQLTQFGAAIYVADLVGIAMVREMGSMMTAILISGRTGAAFAAQLGTMKVRQEIDAFRVVGVSPVEFLVLPRLLALGLMVPLLTVYADLVGILGGFVVAKAMLGLSLTEYWHETMLALSITQFGTGLIKSVVFGIIVAVTGCLRGMQCGDNAAAVGLATTSAVVTSITWIVVADAVFAVLFNVLGI